ncbi:MAG: hypothetical protein F4045_00900 [Chloroflexi bacterium]|nr:hypothetical protein [Chloroflexota bacterium]MYK33703.1 hypothetical protein [Chloroflexota bacterium]
MKRSHIAFIAIGGGLLLFAGSLYVVDQMVDNWSLLPLIASLVLLFLYPVLLIGLMCRWRSLPVARLHPWEVFLLLSVPAWMGWLSALATLTAGWLPLQWLVVYVSSVVTTAVLVVLIATYPWVRRYGRELLKLLWEVSIVLVVGTLAFWLAPLLLGYGHKWWGVTILALPFGSDYWDALYHLSADGLFSLVVLVWFMRRAAARTSRLHAFLLLALAGASLSFPYQGLLDDIFLDRSYDQHFAVVLWQVATPVGMNILLLWALIRYHVDTPPVRVVAALIALPVLRELTLLAPLAVEQWVRWGWWTDGAVWTLRIVLELLPVLVLGYWFTRPRAARSEGARGPA